MPASIQNAPQPAASGPVVPRPAPATRCTSTRWTAAAQAALDVELPRLETLVQGAGSLAQPVHDLTFSGLQFSYATWNAPSGADGLRRRAEQPAHDRREQPGHVHFLQPGRNLPVGRC